jgi:formylglycine-generating enzyme required for sulfatase activity
VDIESGPFVYGGPGEPRTRVPGTPDPEEVIDLPAFAIDRTEVSNAQFAPFAQMRRVTGYPVPDYPQTELHKDAGLPRIPVTSIDAFEAEAFCRFLGKRLPGDHEWVKAARGGLTIHGKPNPVPRRLYPWGGDVPAHCANIAGIEDGYRWLAPVDALPCGASPYGVLNLAGNAGEWISRQGQTDHDVDPLWIVRGGEVISPPELEQGTTVIRNDRQGRQFTFSVGFRCVRGGQEP